LREGPLLLPGKRVLQVVVGAPIVGAERRRRSGLTVCPYIPSRSACTCPTFAVSALGGAFFETVPLTGRVGIRRIRFLEHPAQVIEMRLRGRSLLQLGRLPLPYKFIWRHKKFFSAASCGGSLPYPGGTACATTCSANGRFCPIIRRTRTLTGFLEQGLAARARDRRPYRRPSDGLAVPQRHAAGGQPASFEIEGERPPRNRLER
jgi:hypothetical protein